VTAWQCISPEVTVKVFKKWCISSAVDGTDGGTLWNSSEVDGMSRVSVRHMKALIIKMEAVTLFGKAESNMLCILVYEINSKTFFLADVLFWGGGGKV